MKKLFKTLLLKVDKKIVWMILFFLNLMRLKASLKLWNRRWKFKYLNEDLFRHKSDCILFILGSGSSVEKLKKAHWEEVSSNFSIGLNLWLVHKFLPTFYAFELDEFVPDQYFFDRARILKSKITNQYKPSILLFPRGIYRDNLPIPKDLYDNTFIYTTAPTLSHLVTFSNFVINKTIHWTSNEKRGWPTVFGDGASIERMISIGIKSRFKKIVLVGVDLNDTTCFYDVNPDYFEKNNFKLPDDPRKHLSVHKTMDRSVKKITVLDTIPLMSDYANSIGIKIYVESKSSELAKYLPVFEWKK